MTDTRGSNDMSNQSNCSESYEEYLKRAANACEAGDLVLGMHLYLAAYERAVADPDIPDGMAITGLHEAWNLACVLKERSMAEYVFEKLEPFLTGDEIASYASELQNLALDRLEQYGFSREELQDMADIISQDLMDSDGSILKVESISIPRVVPVDTEEDEAERAEGSAFQAPAAEVASVASEPVDAGGSYDDEPIEPEAAAARQGKPSQVEMGVASADDFNPYELYNTSSVGRSYHAATNEGAGGYVFTRDDDRAGEWEAVREREEQQQADEPTAEPVAAASAVAPSVDATAAEERTQPGDAVAFEPPASEPTSLAKPPADAPEAEGRIQPAQAEPHLEPPASTQPRPLNYRTLAGYEETIALMRDFGIGLHRDPGFRNFVNMMNSRHGIDRMPTLDTLLFRAPVVEDATRFVEATIGEIGLPVLRMSMEEGVQGMPVLCVTTQGNSRPRMNHAHNRFDGPGILVIDEIDMWAMPQPPEGVDGIANFVMANMSRGAREAVNLIRSAVEDPDVYVLATASSEAEIDPFFLDIVEPVTIIDIAHPTDRERDAMWRQIMHDHPSMRQVNRGDLVRFSADLPRYDIYMAARSALEEAYKVGLAQRMYRPVTPQNIFEKLAACQPLESDMYREIEDTVVCGFRKDLEKLEDLLDESGE